MLADYGLLLLGIVCLLISGRLIIQYQKQKNSFTLNLMIFFFLTGLGYLVWYLVRYMEVEEDYNSLVVILSVLAPLFLLLFILRFLGVPRNVQAGLGTLFTVVTVIYLILPELTFLYIVVVTIVAILNIILFLKNYRRRNDVKSLGFAIGLLMTLIGSFPMISMNLFFSLAAICWAITFFAPLEK